MSVGISPITECTLSSIFKKFGHELLRNVRHSFSMQFDLEVNAAFDSVCSHQSPSSESSQFNSSFSIQKAIQVDASIQVLASTEFKERTKIITLAVFLKIIGKVERGLRGRSVLEHGKR